MAVLSDADLLARLVAFDTTSRNSNLPLARFLADYLDRPGITVRELPSPDGTKANLLVRIGPPLDPEAPPEVRRGLTLSGHMDVVPADDTDRWSSDPFVLADRGDRWVARGSADMKGFLALASNLTAQLDPGRLAHPLVLLFTYDEEVGCLGAEHLVRTWRAGEGEPEGLPRAAVIGEPTELSVVRVHKGHVKVRLTYPGVSAHSAYPHLGVNAIEAAAEGVRALGELRRELAAERIESSELFPEVPFAPLNVGTVRGGVAVNVVPDRCTIEVGVRLLPGMDAGEVERRVRSAVKARLGKTSAAEIDRRSFTRGAPYSDPVAASPERSASEASGRARGEAPRSPLRGEGSRSAAVVGEESGPLVEVLSASPPLETDPGADVVRELLAAVGQEGADAVSYATDGGWLSGLGLDCAIWGPGSISVAHKPDEWLPKADLARAREVLGGLIERFCVAESGA
jgi:acetylornithine deacetylase